MRKTANFSCIGIKDIDDGDFAKYAVPTVWKKLLLACVELIRFDEKDRRHESLFISTSPWEAIGCNKPLELSFVALETSFLRPKSLAAFIIDSSETLIALLEPALLKPTTLACVGSAADDAWIGPAADCGGRLSHLSYPSLHGKHHSSH